MKNSNNLVGIKIDFHKNSTKPQRVFDAMSNLIESIQSLHSCFLSCISVETEVQLLLSDIKEGSLISWLSSDTKNKKNLLNETEKNGIDNFLHKCDQIVIEFLNDKDTIKDISEIDVLEREIEIASDELKLNELVSLFSLNKPRVLKCLSSIGNATNKLQENDLAYIELSSGSFLINKKFSLSDIETKQLLSIKVEESTFEKTLSIKKAVFIGHSMWDFVEIKQAKMLDYEWIDNFQHRNEIVLPGDQLRCNIKSTISYDKNGNIVDEKYEILRVLNKIENTQTNIF